MQNNKPNLIINDLYKRFLKLSKDSGGDYMKYDYDAELKIKEEVRKIHSVVGAVEVMSKNAILKLVLLNGRLRAIPFHQFHFPFAKALNQD